MPLISCHRPLHGTACIRPSIRMFIHKSIYYSSRLMHVISSHTIHITHTHTRSMTRLFSIIFNIFIPLFGDELCILMCKSWTTFRTKCMLLNGWSNAEDQGQAYTHIQLIITRDTLIFVVLSALRVFLCVKIWNRENVCYP